MSDNKPYELERDSRIMSYLPGGKSIGGMIDAVELTLDELSDDHFETVKALIEKIRAHKFNPEERAGRRVGQRAGGWRAGVG